MPSNYSLNRRDKKIAGVCSTFGDIFNVDPTILRIGLIAVAILISWKLAMIAYIGGAIYLHTQKKKAERGLGGRFDYERMGDVGTSRTSVHAMRTELDETDRRMMAIDHHIASQKDHELAREIEALREKNNG